MAHILSVECVSLNKSTSYLPLCLSLDSSCDKTSKNLSFISPETRCTISVKRPLVQVPSWISAGFASQPVGSSPNLSCTISESQSVSLSVVFSSLQPMDCTLPGSSVHGILQARLLSGLPSPSPRNPPDPGIEPKSPALQADSLPSESPGKQFQKCLLKVIIKQFFFK